MALALAFSVIPIAAVADDDKDWAQLSPAQRQAIHQTFERFATQEEQLHLQMRSQILSGLSPVHRRAVGATIGDLAVAANPDPEMAAKRLDMILSPGERQRVLTAHSSFYQQSRQLHDQMRTELRSEMPADAHPSSSNHDRENQMAQMQPDAGMVLLAVLSPHPHMMDMGDHHGFGMHMEGAPPH
ncbi:MAG: hypothetical protein JO190_01975 [Candidatus Eremiobacteraeota bacterium]|nr:hypothetical protein [Candidatus Eremiobacteraeota bacterium]MBV8499809.1 hypothetical protein [Candidatus Eremiobacteraeota bacterium]